MIDDHGYKWIMDDENIEVMRIAYYKRKIKVRRKRKYKEYPILIWNPFLRNDLPFEWYGINTGSDKE